MTEVMTRVNTKTHCRYCHAELSFDEKRKCRVCWICHPPEEPKKAEPKPKPKFLDERMTEERVREIVQDELENWHIQKPPVTKEDIERINSTNTVPTEMEVKEKTWRDKAKEMGIKLHQETGGVRKKVDVLADIERTESGLQEKLRTEEQAGSGRGKRPSVDT